MSNEDLHQKADHLLNQGLLAEAGLIYETILSTDQNDADAWLIIGSIDGVKIWNRSFKYL